MTRVVAGVTSGQPYTVNSAEIKAPSIQIMAADITWDWLNPTTRAEWRNVGHRDPSTWYEGATPNFGIYLPVLHLADEPKGPNGSWSYSGYWSVGQYMPVYRHFGHPNVLYCDGHVKTRPMLEIYQAGCGNPASEWCNGR